MRPCLSHSVFWALIFVSLASSQVSAYKITVLPDTLHYTCRLPTDLQSQEIYISDGDTIGPGATLAHVTLHFSGDTNFFIDGSLSQSFRWSDIITVYCRGDGSVTRHGLLTISDSTGICATIVLINNPPYYVYSRLVVTGDTLFDSLVPGEEKCRTFSIHNYNIDTVTLTGITQVWGNTDYRVTNARKFPFVMAPLSSTTFDLCVTGKADTGANYQAGIAVADSRFGGSDTAYITVDGSRFRLLTDSTCLKLYSDTLGSIREGDTGEVWEYIQTKSGEMVIDSVEILNTDLPGGFKVVGPTFPFEFSSLDYQPISLQCIMPNPAQDEYYATIAVYAKGFSLENLPCSPFIAKMFVTPWVDWLGDTIELPSNGKTITVATKSHRAELHLVVHNLTGSRVTLTSASIPDTTSFAYFSESNSHTLELHDTISAVYNYLYPPLRLMLRTKYPGRYSFDLTLNYTNSLQSEHYTVVVNSSVTPLSSVSSVSAPSFDFSLTPNPARDDVTISLPPIARSTVEIYDVIGNLVLRKGAMGKMNWSPKEASGIYIVRVSQHLANGSIATSSKRLVFER